MDGAKCSFLDLSNDVICVLLRYLDATSLYQLSRTCSRLDELIRSDFTLWRCIDARRQPHSIEKFAYCLDRCYDDGNTWTHTFLISSNDNTRSIIPAYFFTTVSSFKHLTVLAFENQLFDGSEYNVMAFPPQLEELSLKRTSVLNPSEFFKGSGSHFTKLRVLILDFCNWMMSSAFVPISKYENLEILSVYCCINVDDCIAYLSLSAHGFKSLKIIDARLSGLGNTLIQALYRIPSLLAIYLQNRDISYKFDCLKKKLENLKKQQADPDVNFMFNAIEEYHPTTFPSSREHLVADSGFFGYFLVQSDGKNIDFPKSVLYKDPYNVCTCGYNDIVLEEEDSDEGIDMDGPPQSLSSKIKKLTKVIKRYQRNGARDVNHIHPRMQQHNNSIEGRPTINIYINPRNQDEPPNKRRRTNDDNAGPSGLNAPPEPIHLNPPERILHLPAVHIEHLNDAQKDIKVPLRRLSLRGFNRITNYTLRCINNLDLDILDLTYTSVTVDGIKTYLKSHPLCRIVHEQFCTCLINFELFEEV